MTIITIENFTAALEKAVADRGEDYIYPEKTENPAYGNSKVYDQYLADDYHVKGGQCVYSTPNGEPACLIGVALHNLGLQVPEYGFVGGASEVLLNEPYELEEGITYLIADAADAAQGRQDNGETWGVALQTFKEAIGR